MTQKVKMVCDHCGSEDVLADAWASWNIESQEWELSQTFDDKYCENCESSCKVNEEPVDEQ
jgi:hypothetical protein